VDARSLHHHDYDPVFKQHRIGRKPGIGMLEQNFGAKSQDETQGR